MLSQLVRSRAQLLEHRRKARNPPLRPPLRLLQSQRSLPNRASVVGRKREHGYYSGTALFEGRSLTTLPLVHELFVRYHFAGCHGGGLESRHAICDSADGAMKFSFMNRQRTLFPDQVAFLRSIDRS